MAGKAAAGGRPVCSGSVTDVVPRLVFEQIATRLSQGIIVENRPGAGGTTAASFVAADGYTVLISSSAHTIAPALYPNFTFSPTRGFAAVVPLGILPSVLVVPPQRNWGALKDLIAARDAHPVASKRGGGCSSRRGHR